MVKILATPREILYFPRQGLGWKALGDLWCGMASFRLCKSCTISSRLPLAASQTVLGEGNELKNWMLEQTIETKLKHPFSPKKVLLIVKL